MKFKKIDMNEPQAKALYDQMKLKDHKDLTLMFLADIIDWEIERRKKDGLWRG